MVKIEKNSVAATGRAGRNHAVDAYKFIFCCIIAMFHFFGGSDAHMVGGAAGVEFFVMAAGLFFFQKLERETAACYCRNAFRSA